MLINQIWSAPKPLEYGKDILVKSSHPNFSFRIYNATGKSVDGVIMDRVYTIHAADELIRLVRLPMISFKANTVDELHVEFELV